MNRFSADYNEWIYDSENNEHLIIESKEYRKDILKNKEFQSNNVEYLQYIKANYCMVKDEEITFNGHKGYKWIRLKHPFLESSTPKFNATQNYFYYSDTSNKHNMPSFVKNPKAYIHLRLNHAQIAQMKQYETEYFKRHHHNIQKTESMDCKLWSMVWISRIFPAFAVFCAIIYLFIIFTTPSVWSTNKKSSQDQILSRTAERGMATAMLLALLMNIVGAFMFYIRVRESLVITNYGFILHPVMLFLANQSIGTDEGWRSFGTKEGYCYTFSCLIGGDFARFIVTVFLEIFINNPIQDILKIRVVEMGVLDYLNCKEDKHKWLAMYDAFVAMVYPSILQSVVGFVAFNAFANQTRFAWAYPGALDRGMRIPAGAIMLSTVIAGVAYLNFYIIVSFISGRAYYDMNIKVMYVLIILALLYGLNQTDCIEAPIQGEVDVVWTEGLGEWKPLLGLLVFVFFVLYGFVYPIWTRLGCCGMCKPKDVGIEEYEDHISITVVPRISHVVMEEMKDEIRKELLNE